MKKLFISICIFYAFNSTYAQPYLPISAGISNPLGNNLYFDPAPGSTRWILLNGTDALSGALALQAGGGSNAYGGGLGMFSHSHPTKPGWVSAGISAGSGGKFTVNSYGSLNGTDVFKVDASGNTTISGELEGTTAKFSSDVTVSGTTTNMVTTFKEGTTAVGYIGRGAAITGGWGGYPNAMALTYQERDFVIGGWSKSGSGWMGPAFYINSDNSNVGIGTTTPTEKLSVNGIIRSKEVRVEASPWPDYVFKSDYKLRELKDVERYIAKNGHLPEIPSAKDVEENGINLGEMNSKLLQKIEELTLHMIELSKENTTIKERLLSVEKRK